MPRVIYYTATTLNGFLADESDSLEWLFEVPDDDPPAHGFDEFLEGIGAIVQGASTYEWVVAHEDLIAHPEKWPTFYGPRPSFVFTTRTRPDIPGADVRFVSGPVLDAWPQIRAAVGAGDVWLVGGGDLAGQFADAGLLDELRVSVTPVTLSSGKPLLPRRLESDRLHLESARKNGQFVELVYSVKPPR